MDNHKCHVLIAAVKRVRENCIILLTLPQHTAQHLPVGGHAFRSFKYYNAACSNWMLTDPGRPISVFSVGYLTGVWHIQMP
jgi:hypothetical protein